MLKRAVLKHGVQVFKKEVIKIFFNAEEAYKLESLLVCQKTVDDPLCYNLKVGGQGGFDYLNNTGLNTTGVKKRDYKLIGKKTSITKSNKEYIVSEETRQKISQANKRTNKIRGEKISQALKGRKMSKEHRQAISTALTGRKWGTRKPQKPRKPRKLSEETKFKLSSQRWINNGMLHKRIHHSLPPPDGWVYGRVLNKQK